MPADNLRKKVFIFGAGASRAAQDAQGNHQPKALIAPLVDELFRRPYREAGAHILSVSDLDRCDRECKRAIENGGSLEGWLTEQWTAIPKFGAQKQSAEKAFFGRVCFYLWRLLQRVSQTYVGAQGNTYFLFMEKLREYDEQFGLINFNYDTLLDQAVKEVHGALLDSPDSYRSVPLIKPHGSVNWILERSTDPEYRAESISDDPAWFSSASSLMFNGGQFTINQWSVVDPTHRALTTIDHLRSSRDRYFYPLLFMPVTTKWYEKVDGFHERMIEHAQLEIQSADAVYVIGYSASDDVFAQVMDFARKGTSLHVIGRDDGVEAIAERIVKRHPQLSLEKTYPVGFHRFVDEHF